MGKSIKTKKDIELLHEGGQLLGDILRRTAQLARPGVSTAELSDFADQEIRKAGGRPSFIGYGPKDNPFPAALCTSINDVVVHGIPSRHDVLASGDVLGLDIGMVYKDLYTDTALTVAVGTVTTPALRMIETARLALEEAINQVKPGNRIGDIGFAIQSVVEKAGFSVVRDLVGHGVGYAIHEDPAVPCYGKPGKGLELEENMVIAIEPMICQKKPNVIFDPDGWTIRTADGGLAAHFEHTVAVTKTGVRVLT